jgi:cellulose synthase operon protein C
LTYFRKAAFLMVVPALLAVPLDFWSTDTVADSVLERALYRNMEMPGGPILVRRVPAESIKELSGTRAYSIRAIEAERALDFPHAEADWIAAGNKIELADFYHRRLEPEKEVDAILASGGDYARAATVAHDAALSEAVRDRIYQAWISHDPADKNPLLAYFDLFVVAKNATRAQAIQKEIAGKFPTDTPLILDAEARVAGIDGGPLAALNTYDQHFDPLWPEDVRKRYFGLLKEAHQLRAFQAKYRDDPARQFFYAEQEGNRPECDRILLAWEGKSGNPEMLAQLFRRVGDYESAARVLAKSAGNEESLAAIIDLLLEVPEQSISLGERDLSLYANAAQIDPHPGFLNGILSVALNTTFPQSEYANASQNARSYFHRAAASNLLARLRQRFPNSNHLPALDAKLFGAYAAYAQNDVLIRLVPGWLDHNTQAPQYVDTALLLATAYSNTNHTSDEFALYDKLLAQLGTQSKHMPIGATPTVTPYSRILDRYIARLTQARRPLDAIALFKKEIDRNPNDPGLYQRLALYVEQNRLDAALADAYRTAFDHFKDVSWADKLARLYLRRKQYTAYQALTRQLTETFRGSELANFVEAASPDQKLNPSLYRQINLYAHHRFPHNLTFTRNLLTAYQAKATADPAAYERLLRENWFYDAGLRAQFFEYLTRTGKLDSELAALPQVESAAQQNNVAVIQMRAEGEAWRTRFEAGSGAFVKLAQLVPGDRVFNSRAVAIERSLRSDGPAIALAEQDVKAAPRDSEAIIRVGEIYADQEHFSEAAPWWRRVANVNPGLSNGYLDSATVFWDFFRYRDALQEIGTAREKLHQPALFAYEAGAIYENQNNFREAVDEYVKAALEQPAPSGQNGLAQDRLIFLARKPQTAGLVNQRIAQLGANGFEAQTVALQIALLDSQGQREKIHQLLTDKLSAIQQLGDIDAVKEYASRFGFDDVSLAAIEKTVALSADPIEKIEASVQLALFRENHKDATGAQRELSLLLNSNPNLLGVIRANADFYWRQKQYAQAIATLTEAASRAQPPYLMQLRKDAANRASEAGEYAKARQLLDQLLADDPYNADLLAQKAATYSAANDSRGLADFYSAELKKLSAAPIPAEERNAQINGLRRGYVAALIGVRQFQEALAQYELLINAYPEDEGLLREAVHFADQQHLGDQLLAYYRKAETDSPKNYRWPLVVARMARQQGKYQQALEAYGRAAYIRPDRTDLLLAKADLETRLLHFEDAIETNDKLYNLTYHDTRYLTEEATLNQRLGRAAESLKLLRSAYIEAHPSEAGGYVAVMRQLAAWRRYADVDAVYRELQPKLTEGSEWAAEAVTLEGQSLVNAHRAEDALAAVQGAWKSVKGLSEGGAGNYNESLGGAIRTALTPEEKAVLGDKLSRRGFLQPPFELYGLAHAAGFYEVAAHALAARLTSQKNSEWSSLQQLQQSRLQFEALGKELETWAAKTTEEARKTQLQRAAADAYASAGDSGAELRLARLVNPFAFARLFVAANSNSWNELAELAKTQPKLADAVLQYMFQSKSETEVMKAIATRGSTSKEQWSEAYRALAGLYYLSADPSTSSVFSSLLGPDTIGEKLEKQKAATPNSLKGDTWFYYAARYGDYLTYRQQESGDISAALERSPAASDAYVQVGDTFAAAKQPAKAIPLYRNALQLSPGRADVHDKIAVLLSGTENSGAAVEEWRAALTLLRSALVEGPTPADFIQTTQNILRHLNEADKTEALHLPVVDLLQTYIAKNAGYNFNALAEGLLRGAPNQAKALDQILNLARTSNLDQALEDLTQSDSLTETEKDRIYLFVIDQSQLRVNSSAGDDLARVREQLAQSQVRYAEHLLQTDRAPEAWRVLIAIQPDTQAPANLLLKAAALSGQLESELRKYAAKPEVAPSGDQMLVVASEIASTNPAAALRIREYEYEKEIASGETSAPAYLGLAQVRIDQKQVPEAMQLLKALTIDSGMPFQNHAEVVNLLERNGMKAQALEYATQWSTGEPWTPESVLAVARLKQDTTLAQKLRTSDAAPYQLRVKAALLLRELGAVNTGTDELALLTQKNISPGASAHPFYVASRLEAAKMASPREKVQLLREAIAYDPQLQEPRLKLAEAAIASRQLSFAAAALQSFTETTPQTSSSPDAILLRTVREQVAAALVSQNEFDRGVSVYDQILAGEKRGAIHERTAKLRDASAQAATLASINSQRQPVVSEEITQTVIVRPRLTAIPKEAAVQ